MKKNCPYGKKCQKKGRGCKFRHEEKEKCMYERDCPHQERCKFQHSERDRAYWKRQNEEKEKCENGRDCSYQERCKFQHSERDRAYWKRQNEEKEKCENGRDCSYQERCKFSHSERDHAYWKKQAEEKEKYENGRDCSYQERCKFSHSERDHAYWKKQTQKKENCMYERDCPYQERCKFSHSERDRAYWKRQNEEKEKCMYERDCPYQERCKFQHSERDRAHWKRQNEEKEKCENGRDCSYQERCKFQHSEEDRAYWKRQEAEKKEDKPISPSIPRSEKKELQKNNHSQYEKKKKKFVESLQINSQIIVSYIQDRKFFYGLVDIKSIFAGAFPEFYKKGRFLRCQVRNINQSRIVLKPFEVMGSCFDLQEQKKVINQFLQKYDYVKGIKPILPHEKLLRGKITISKGRKKILKIDNEDNKNNVNEKKIKQFEHVNDEKQRIHSFLKNCKVQFTESDNNIQVKKIEYQSNVKVTGILKIKGNHLFMVSRCKQMDDMIVLSLPQQILQQLRILEIKQYPVSGFIRDFDTPTFHQINRKLQQYIVFGEFFNWPSISKHPIVEIKKIKPYSLQTIKQAIIYEEKSIEYIPESIQQEQQVQKLIRQKQAKIKQKKQKILFTIDTSGTGCKDDAISIEQLKENQYRIGIHVTDVASWIGYGTELDKKAKKRNSTIYIKNYTMKMLPHQLTYNRLSLLQGTSREVLSLYFTINSKEGLINFNEVSIQESIQNIAKNFTYQQADKIMANFNSPYAKSLNMLYQFLEKRNELQTQDTRLCTFKSSKIVAKLMNLGSNLCGFMLQSNFDAVAEVQNLLLDQINQEGQIIIDQESKQEIQKDNSCLKNIKKVQQNHDNLRDQQYQNKRIITKWESISSSENLNDSDQWETESYSDNSSQYNNYEDISTAQMENYATKQIQNMVNKKRKSKISKKVSKIQDLQFEGLVRNLIHQKKSSKKQEKQFQSIQYKPIYKINQISNDSQKNKSKDQYNFLMKTFKHFKQIQHLNVIEQPTTTKQIQNNFKEILKSRKYSNNQNQLFKIYISLIRIRNRQHFIQFAKTNQKNQKYQKKQYEERQSIPNRLKQMKQDEKQRFTYTNNNEKGPYKVLKIFKTNEKNNGNAINSLGQPQQAKKNLQKEVNSQVRKIQNYSADTEFIGKNEANYCDKIESLKEIQKQQKTQRQTTSDSNQLLLLSTDSISQLSTTQENLTRKKQEQSSGKMKLQKKKQSKKDLREQIVEKLAENFLKKSSEKLQKMNLRERNEKFVNFINDENNPVLKWNSPLRNYNCLQTERFIKKYLQIFQGNLDPSKVVQLLKNMKEIQQKVQKLKYKQEKSKLNRIAQNINAEIAVWQFYENNKQTFAANNVHKFLLIQPPQNIQLVFHPLLGTLMISLKSRNLIRNNQADYFKEWMGVLQLTNTFPVIYEVQLIRPV